MAGVRAVAVRGGHVVGVEALHYLVVPGVFLASIPVAAIDAEAGMYSWLALPVLIHVINRRQRAAGDATS